MAHRTLISTEHNINKSHYSFPECIAHIGIIFFCRGHINHVKLQEGMWWNALTHTRTMVLCKRALILDACVRSELGNEAVWLWGFCWMCLIDDSPALLINPCTTFTILQRTRDVSLNREWKHKSSYKQKVHLNNYNSNDEFTFQHTL